LVIKIINLMGYIRMWKELETAIQRALEKYFQLLIALATSVSCIMRKVAMPQTQIISAS